MGVLILFQERIKLLTFDCYGTLIDWRTGIRAYLKDLLIKKGATISLDEFYDHWYKVKLKIMAGSFHLYKDVLQQSLKQALKDYNLKVETEDGEDFGETMKTWEPFAESKSVLKLLSKHYALGTISNCQNDIIKHAVKKLGNPFTYIITAEDARSYKPNARPFQLILEKAKVKSSEVFHTAQSQDVDLPRSKPMGIRTAWINRHNLTLDSGTPIPDYEFTNLNPLLELLKC